MKIKVGIVGSTGYTGVVLVRLLLNHPNVEITYLSSEQFEGKDYSLAYPMFYETLDLKCKSVNPKEIAKCCDLVFLATPNDFSKEFIPKLLHYNDSLKIIDLSADLRLIEKIKASKHDYKITYGLSEIYRKEIKHSQIIANPGCYPTSVILALAPLIRNKLVNLNSIIIDSKSGTSGAGKQIKQELHFTEVNESFKPYALAGTHRHIEEIENELLKIVPKSSPKFNVVFSPHLLPINRGILSTIYADPRNTRLTQEDLDNLYKSFYKNEYFVKVFPSQFYPQTKNVRYSNFCHITPLVDQRTNKLILVSAIDNMVKGASGQAVQNMNIMSSFDEKSGLDNLGQLP